MRRKKKSFPVKPALLLGAAGLLLLGEYGREHPCRAYILQ